MEKLNMEQQILRKINSLYISTRKKYLKMYARKDGIVDYRTYSSNKAILVDYVLKRHIQKKSTIGVFSGQYLSKFICFDVDTDNLTRAKWITYRLVDVLINDYGIPEDYINVSFSGSKGYHVELFFTEMIKNEDIKRFYHDVLAKLGGLDNHSKVELRPTATQGVKIPLSKHFRTNRDCCYVDTITLEEIEDQSHILSIKQMKKKDFKALIFGDDVFSLSFAEAEEFQQVMDETNIENKSLDEIVQDVEAILQKNRLIRDGTRNNVTLFVAMYLYSSGLDIVDVRERIKELLHNTWITARDFISHDTTYEFMMAEVDRITAIVFKKQYVLGKGKKEIKISKGEILKILELKSLHLKKLMFSILIHYKKHKKKDKTFFMAYSVMTRMGNTANRQRLLNYIIELQKLGLIDIVRRNELNKALSRELGKAISETNVYRITMEEEFENQSLNATITLNTTEEIDFFDVVANLITENEIKKILPKSQYYNTGLKEAYEKKHIV